MGFIRRLFGLIATMVGLIGLLLFLAGIGLIWFANNRVKDGARRAMEPAEESVKYVQNQLEKGDRWLSTMRTRLGRMKRQVDQLAAIDQQALGKELDQVELDQEAVEYNLQRADLLVNVSRESVGTLTELSGLAESIPAVSLHEYSSQGPLATQIKRADDQLGQLSAIMQQIRETLAKVRSQQQQLSPQTLQQLGGQLERAESKLAETHVSMAQFRDSLQSTAGDIIAVKKKIPGWIDTGSWVLTAILAWLGISQYALAVYGQSLLKS